MTVPTNEDFDDLDEAIDGKSVSEQKPVNSGSTSAIKKSLTNMLEARNKRLERRAKWLAEERHKLDDVKIDRNVNGLFVAASATRKATASRPFASLDIAL